MPKVFKILSLAVLLIGGLSLPAFADASPYGGVWKGSLAMDNEIAVPSGIELELTKNGDSRIIKRFRYPSGQQDGKWVFVSLTGTITPLEDSQGQFDLSNGASLLVTMNLADDHHMSLSWVAGNHLYEVHLSRK